MSTDMSVFLPAYRSLSLASSHRAEYEFASQMLALTSCHDVISSLMSRDAPGLAAPHKAFHATKLHQHHHWPHNTIIGPVYLQAFSTFNLIKRLLHYSWETTSNISVKKPLVHSFHTPTHKENKVGAISGIDYFWDEMLFIPEWLVAQWPEQSGWLLTSPSSTPCLCSTRTSATSVHTRRSFSSVCVLTLVCEHRPNKCGPSRGQVVIRRDCFHLTSAFQLPPVCLQCQEEFPSFRNNNTKRWGDRLVKQSPTSWPWTGMDHPLICVVHLNKDVRSRRDGL